MSKRHAAQVGNAATPPPADPGESWTGRLLAYRESGVVIAILLVLTAFTVLESRFLSLETMGDVLTVAAELGVVATGVTLLMIAGEFDLSVGSNFAFSAMILALAVDTWGWNPWISFICALLIGSAIGWINGYITLSTGIPSFITTLGTMMFWRGLALFITGGWPVSIYDDIPLIRILGGGNLFSTAKISAVWWLALAALFWFVLVRTQFGNWVFATGGKQPAARSLGVPTTRVKMMSFMLTGLLAALAGCLQFGRMGSMSPVWGDKLELEAIAAAVIGGTSLTGGVGTVFGTMLGALTMASIRIGLVMVGAPSYWYMSFIGIMIVVAVIINVKLGRIQTWRK